jgi:hypothetical protein
MSTPLATAIIVLYRTTSLDLEALPPGTPVVLVHNDRSLPSGSVRRDDVSNLHPEGNLGFGAGVNLALRCVRTPRVVIVNPDAELTSAHWQRLCDGPPDEVRTIPIDDDEGRPTSIVNRYPTAFGHLLSGFRVGRRLDRGSRLRSWLSRHGGSFARANDESLRLRSGRWPLTERWASGAVLSIDSERLRSIDGFDPRFFLYYEDVDLCGRLAAQYPTMDLVLLEEEPARHSVGGSAEPGGAVEKHRLASAVAYASGQPGVPWRITAALLRLRQRWV